MKENSEIVLSALLSGQKILINGHLYFLSEDRRIGYVHKPSENNVLEDELSGYEIDLTLSGFIKLCDKMDKKDVFVISSETALSKMKNDENKHKKRHQKEEN